MDINCNKIQDKVRQYLKKNEITTAIEFLDDFLRETNIQDEYFSDAIVAISQRNRDLNTFDLKGSISYEDRRIERSNITNKILSLVNEIPILLDSLKTNEDQKSLIPQINYLELISKLQIEFKEMKNSELKAQKDGPYRSAMGTLSSSF